MDEDRDDNLDAVLTRACEALRASPPTPLPPNFAAAVAKQAAARPAGGPLDWLGERVAGWFRPRVRSVRPALQWAWVVGLCALTAVVAVRLTSPSHGGAAVLVRFAVDAPSARSVSVAGDFNDWDPRAVRLMPGTDGRWHAVVPLEPGVYQYMFVVDGERWIPDPQAAETLDDGFGQRNSLVRIHDSGGAAAQGGHGFL